MRSAAAIFSGLALLGALALGGPALAARPPVVVELFTAQGCSSCAAATEAVAALAPAAVDALRAEGTTEMFSGAPMPARP